MAKYKILDDNKEKLQTLSSDKLLNILKNDYEIFGVDTDIKEEYKEYENWIKNKRKDIIKILLERMEK